MRRPLTNDDAAGLALNALAWTLEDDERASRLVALTGLAPADLRARLGDPGVLAAVLSFLAANERDLLACAEALEVAPATLTGAQAALEAA